MKVITKLLVLFTLMFSTQLINAQPWMDSVKSEKPNFKEVQKAFYDYWKDKTIEKGKGYKPFKRWEWYWESRVSANGEFPSPSITRDEWEKYDKAHPESSYKTNQTANWTFNGPSTTPGGYYGLGRINCIAFHPTNSNIFWVGTPAGGLWKTTNGGSSWTTNTDKLPVLGISDIAIDPTNPNIMYIATGDGDMGSLSGNTKSIGILKSTDGGSTWKATGMNWSVTSAKLIRRLVMNPKYPKELHAATSEGIYSTYDGGTNWKQSLSATYFIDIEFKPNNADTLYASTYDFYNDGYAEIYRSTDYGQSWSSVATLSKVKRINLEVSPNLPDYVSALGSDKDGGLAGIWYSYSSNSGASFKQLFYASSNSNLLHISHNASGSGGQGYYDLAYAINPNNYRDTWLGGINTWNSKDYGQSWSLKTMWATSSNSSSQAYNPKNVPVVHADKHFIAFHPLVSGTMFECNDGGLYKTTDGGSTWKDLSNGLQISQIYRIGVSQTTANNVICGLQDNGTREFYNGNWYEASGGDGMECIIDYTNANIEYASVQNGKIYKTTDGWKNSSAIVSSSGSGVNENGNWVTPYIMHPTNNKILLIGKSQVYKTTDGGNNWSQLGTISGMTGQIVSMAYAPSNTQTIYVAGLYEIFKTTDGGNTWSKVGVLTTPITYIAVDPNNSKYIYITNSGYVANDKVRISSDGGLNWTNFSGSLPNVPVNCIVYQNGTNEGLYIGTDVGVFYRDASMNDWIPFQTGLPNVVVNELEISYNDDKLWAATFGRGLWSSDLYTSTAQSPAASFTSSKTNICENDCISFTDNSTNTPKSWSWSFPGGNPNKSTSQNPSSICYSTAGTYNVSMTATNSGGSDTKTNYFIKVYDCTNVSEIENTADISIFPNPSSGSFTVNINDKSDEAYSIVIYNLLGEKIWEQKNFRPSIKSINIDLEKYSNGIYLAHISSAKSTMIEKIILTK